MSGHLQTLHSVLEVLGELYVSQGNGAPFYSVLGPLRQSGPALQILSEADKLHLKLASILSYVQAVTKQPVPLSVYSSLLCSLLREFRAALLSVPVTSSLDKVIDLCVALLKQDRAHTALLMVVEHISGLSAKVGNHLRDAVKEVLLPLIVLLKATGEGPQMEVVARAEQFIAQTEIQSLLRTPQTERGVCVPSISTPEFQDFLFPGNAEERFATLGDALTAASSFPRSHTAQSLKAKKTLLHRRCNSLRSCEVYLVPNDLSTHTVMFPALLHRGARSPPPTPYFPQLLEVYEESLRDNISESHDVPAKLPSPRFFQAVVPLSPVAALTGDDVMLELSVSEGSLQHEHPYMSNFQEILRLEKEPDTPPTWELVCSRANVNVYKKRADDTPVCMIKAYCLLDHPPEVVFKAMVDVNVRIKWDKLFNELEVFDPHEYHDYLYYVVKASTI